MRNEYGSVLANEGSIWNRKRIKYPRLIKRLREIAETNIVAVCVDKYWKNGKAEPIAMNKVKIIFEIRVLRMIDLTRASGLDLENEDPA